MRNRDNAQTITNTRLLAAVYFGLLSVVGTILINGFLSILGIKEIVPLYVSIPLGMVIASSMGAIFGESIVHCNKPYQAITFWLGFTMVLVSLPVFDLGLLVFMSKDVVSAYLVPMNSVQDLLMSYLQLLLYSYCLFGFGLAIAAGLAAMYLRGFLVYDILDTTHERRKHKRDQKFTLVTSDKHHKA